jgi:hypothetical protein
MPLLLCLLLLLSVLVSVASAQMPSGGVGIDPHRGVLRVNKLLARNLVPCATANGFVTGFLPNGTQVCRAPVSTDLTDSTDLVRLTAVQKVSNKQNVPKEVLYTPAANAITPNCDTTDIVVVNAISAPLTVNNPVCTGTNPEPSQELTFRFFSTAPRALTWGDQYSTEAGVPKMISTTGDGVTYDYAMVKRNSVTLKWDFVAVKALDRTVTTLATSATFTCNVDVSWQCQMTNTATAGTGITIDVPQGTPEDGQLLWIGLRCTVGSQTVTWHTIFIDGVYQTRPTTCPLDATKYLQVLVRFSNVLTKWEVLVGASAGGTGGTGYLNLPITGVKLPASNPAAIDTSEPNNRLLFDANISECVIWQFVMPGDYTGSPVLKVQYSMLSDANATHSMSITVSVAAVTPGDAGDIFAKAYAAANTCTDAAIPATVGQLDQILCPLTTNDSLAAGDYTRIQLCRNTAVDTATGDLEVVGAGLSYSR